MAVSERKLGKIRVHIAAETLKENIITEGNVKFGEKKRLGTRLKEVIRSSLE